MPILQERLSKAQRDYITQPRSHSQEEKLEIKLRWADTQALALNHITTLPPPRLLKTTGKAAEEMAGGPLGSGEETRDCAGLCRFTSFAQEPSWSLAAAAEKSQTEIRESPRTFRFPHAPRLGPTEQKHRATSGPGPLQASSGHPPLPLGAHSANARACLPAWGVGAGVGGRERHERVLQAPHPPPPLDGQRLLVPGL